jgi:uncharacterized membrane protein
METMKAKDWFIDFGKGAALGTGILPGVSVGTVGIIVRIYEKLLSTINDLRKHFGKAFLTLLPIALGCIISAIFLLWGYSKIQPYAGFEVVALFAGLHPRRDPRKSFMRLKQKLSKRWTSFALLSVL